MAKRKKERTLEQQQALATKVVIKRAIWDHCNRSLPRCPSGVKAPLKFHVELPVEIVELLKLMSSRYGVSKTDIINLGFIHALIILSSIDRENKREDNALTRFVSSTYIAKRDAYDFMSSFDL